MSVLIDTTCLVALRCKVCTKFADKLKGSRNFNPTYTEGSSNLRTSSFIDHAYMDMHHKTMTLLKRETATDVRSYTPIALALYHIDNVTEETLKKFDLTYRICSNSSRGYY